MTDRELTHGNGKIFVGIPRERFYLTQFVDNRDSIIAHMGKEGVMGGYFQAESHRVDHNRDRIVENFLKNENKPEWLLMLDSDMDHPLDCGIRMAKYRKPIVGALYFQRGPTTHTPFVFKTIAPRKDAYGRPTLLWAPMNKVVYEYLQMNGIPMRDGGMSINNSVGEHLIECDAVATGCILIHRDVLEDMPKPIFEYRNHGNSEDLTFCKEAKERGWSVYCDLSTICGHYHWVPMGQAQFRMNYINQGINDTAYTKRGAALWYSKAFNVTEEEAVKIIEEGSPHVVGELWKERFGDRTPTPEEVQKFYEDPKVGERYVVELLHWNFDINFGRLRQVLVGIRESNVIELGAGIGSIAIQLILQENNVLAVEVNQVLRDFIDMRWAMMKEEQVDYFPELSIVSSDWKEKCADASFDNCVAIDTFEHMSVEELTSCIKALDRILKPNGRLVFHNNWQQQDLYPMHFDNHELFTKLLEENHFIVANEMEAIHV